MKTRSRAARRVRVILLVSFATTLVPSVLPAVETLALNRTLSSGGATTGSTSFGAAASVSNSATAAADVTVMASFSADPAGGNGGRFGEWRLTAAGQQSTVIRRDMSDSLSDYGIMNLAWTFSNLAPGAVIALEHRTSVNNLKVATEDITLITIPMTTEPTGVVLGHDLDDQGTYSFVSSSTAFVPVEKAASKSLVASVQVLPMTVPRDVFVAATFSTSKPEIGATDATWKLQYNDVSSPPANECQDGVDVGTSIQRSLSGNNDVGAVMLYAIAENLDPGTYEFRLCAASPSGSSIRTFSVSLLAFALHYGGDGVGGHFPRIQATVALAESAGGNMEPIPGLLDPFTLPAVSDVFLAMSFTALTTASGTGDFGEFETCIEDSSGGFPFGADQNGDSQEVRRRFAASNDRGAGGQVGLAQDLTAGDYTARGCASVTGNPITLENPNLVGFVPRSIDDTTVPVSLAWFRGRAGSIEWATATEVGNLGFHVYGVEDGQARRLNRELIPSKPLDSLASATYRLRAPGFRGQMLLLEDVDITGRSRFHGPFRTGRDYGKKPIAARRIDWPSIRARRTGKLDSSRAQRSAGMSMSRQPISLRTANVGVDRDGIHRLTYETLLAAGVDLTGMPAAHLALKNRGEPVPMRVESHRRFGPGSYLEFVGRALDTLYTGTNVYTLEVDPRAADRIERDFLPPRFGWAPESYMEDRKVEVNRLYDFAAPGESPWYETRLLATSGPVEATYALDLPDWRRGAGPVELTIALWGVTDFPQSPDHHVVVEVNGAQLADEWFDGLAYHPIELEIPERLLSSSGNTLRVRLPHDTGAAYDLVNYDFYRIRYPRLYRAVEGRLSFTAAAPVFRVEGLPSPDVLVYRTIGAEVESVEGVQISGIPGAYSVTFAGGEAVASYYVSTVGALYRPTVDLAPEPVELTGEAQLLILSHPDFLSGVEPLAQARRAEGYSVRVVDVRGVYQRYAGGVFDPTAIREFVQQAHESMRTQFVLMVGGDSYDYRDFTGAGSLSFLPTLYARTGQIVRYAPVDPLYGDVDGDQIPDLAIGRLPARDAAELALLIDKTLDFGSRGGAPTALVSADALDGMSGTSFSEISEGFVADFPEDWAVERAYIDDAGLDSARQVLLETLNDGPSLVSYVGHSGPRVWSFQGLFDTDDVLALGNVGRPSVVTQWGCWNTYFVSPLFDSLAHALLLSGDQGAAAVLGATTLTQTAAEQALGTLFFSRLGQPGLPIGAVLRDAKKDLATTQPDLLDVLLGWTLLGDPTLILEP